ncbi:efflux RND transporter periplasmic adaptor subunit [bacterium]|nr:efflux RND transporter periplasmic adaptor subunit [bacterium]
MSYSDNKKAQWLLFLMVLLTVPIIFNFVMEKKADADRQELMKRPANVQTIKPVMKDIYFEAESAGRLDSKYTVDVLARINGWLQKRFFDEGAKVSKGQTLFKIEPDEYQLAVNNAAANVRQTQAALKNAEQELVRAQELVKNDYVSKSYYDQAVATRDTSKAAFDAAKAQLANAQLNLSYTNVTSPIDGKIGKIIITEGNLVNTQSGPLARIVSVQPIFAYFTLKSSEFLKFKKADTSSDFSNMEIKLQLADGSIYNETGKIEFIDNQVNETTGTISLRATFENADELLVPGDFVKVIVKSTEPRNVLMIPQSAALDDSAGYYVWAVDNDGVVSRKDIKVSDEIDKNWVVEDGLTEDDVIVGKGLQSIRMPGQKVNPTPLEDKQEVEAK